MMKRLLPIALSILRVTYIIAMPSRRLIWGVDPNYANEFNSLVAASDFVISQGVQVGNDTMEGLPIITFDEAGDWAAYSLNLQNSGAYELQVRVASPIGDGAFVVGHLEKQELYATVNSLPATGDLTNSASITLPLTLPAENFTLQIGAIRPGWSLIWMSLEELAFNSSQTEVPLSPVFVSNAANYSAMDGITTGALADGSSFIGFLDPSDWVSYNVLLPFTGTYKVDVSVASPEGAGSFQLANMMTREVYGTFDNLPATDDWTEWRTASDMLDLPEGEWMMELTILESGMNIKSVTISPIEPAPSEAPVNVSSVVPSLPSGTEVPVIPDVSGNSSYVVPDDAYSITIPASTYASMDGVEMGASPNGESIIESLDPGDWIAYPVSLPKSGPFMMEMVVSSPSGEGSFEVYNLITRELYTTVDAIPATQNSSLYNPVSAVVILPEGDLFLEISVIEGGWQLLELTLMELEEISMSNSTLPPGPLFMQSIQAVNYSSMNGITISEDTNGNQVVSGFDAGDWVAYPLNLPYDGTYRLKVSVASPQGQGSFAVENFETEQEYKFIDSLTSSGTWENYTTVDTFLVLPAGLWTMKIHAIEPGWNLKSLTLSKDSEIQPPDFNITIPAIDYSDRLQRYDWY